MFIRLSKEENRTIRILILMSFFSGIFISYYVSYISAVFVKIAGVQFLPLAYILSGLGGMYLTSLFNKFELKYNLKSISLIFLPLLSVSVIVVWYICTYFGSNKIIVFISYSWFWIIGNFMLLLFWKLPGHFLTFGQNKKLLGIISSGEVISAILAYLSIPLFLSQGFIKNESDLLLISFFGILTFFILFIVLNFYSPNSNHVINKINILPLEDKTSYHFFSLIKIPFLKYVFSTVVIAVIIQSTVDFSLMIISKQIITDTKSLASFFGFIFGSAKIFEFVLKTMISNRLLKNYGIQSGIITFSLVICIISLFGLGFHIAGAITFLFIATLLNKMMERSLVRSVFTPTLSILFQVYTGKMQSIAQNFGDGQGKTYGQLLSGFILFTISLIPSFFYKMSMIFLLLILCCICLLYLASKLFPHYRDELKKRISTMVDNKQESPISIELIEDNKTDMELKQMKDSLYYHQLKENVKNYIQYISILQTMQSSMNKNLKLSIKEEVNQLNKQIFEILGCANDKNILNQVLKLIESKEQEQLVMGIEVLSLMLNTQEKVLVLPIFQETKYALILRKLEPYISIPKRTLSETLVHLAFHHPNRYSLKTRYLAIFELIMSKQITFNQLAAACFSSERIIQDLSLFYLGTLYPQRLDEIIARTEKKYPSKNVIDESYSNILIT